MPLQLTNAVIVRIFQKAKVSLTVEFKERYTPKIDRDIVAFANSKGGLLLLGIDDRGKVVGEKLTYKMKAEIKSCLKFTLYKIGWIASRPTGQVIR